MKRIICVLVYAVTSLAPVGRSEAAAPPCPPQLELVLSGPSLRYLERKGLYTLKVTNLGQAPATEAHVRTVVPIGFAVVAVHDGGSYEDSSARPRGIREKSGLAGRAKSSSR